MGFLRDLIVRIKGDKSQLDTALAGAKTSVNSFGTTLKKVGALLGVAFGVREIINFSKEAMRLAAEAEGVKNAFMKIGDAKSVLEDMKRATRGVMNESDLMQLAVKAQNFKIPLKDLGTYFEFATNRAITTGKSVSDLTELIVNGIGYRSKGAMAQLGVSFTDFQKAVKTPGGFLKYINSELDRMGSVADTAAIQIQKLTTSSINLKEAWGNWLNKSEAVKSVREYFITLLDSFASESKTLAEKLKMLLPMYGEWGIKKKQNNIPSLRGGLSQESLDQLDKMQNKANAPNSAPVEKYIETIAELKARLKEGEDALEGFKVTEIDLIAAQQKTNAGLRVQIEQLTKLPQTAKEAAEALEKLKEAHKAFWAETGQLGGLPQNNKTTSVFEKKTYGLSAPLSNKLAGSPVMPDPAEAIAMGEAFQKTLDTDAALKKIDDFQERLKEALTEIQFMAVDLGTQIAESLGEALGGGDVKELGRGLLLSFANFLSQFGKMLIAVGLGLEAFQASIKTMNPALALIAGVALLATAGAIKGLMSKGVSGSGGGSGGGGYSSGGGSHASGQAGKQVIVVEGVIKGKDIFISNRRYVEENG